MRKAINFDLDTHALKEYYCQETGKDYTQAYTEIRQFMTENGFIHRQGSGYVSLTSISASEIMYLIASMQEKLPWIQNCIRTMDLTIIAGQYDLTSELKKDQRQTKEQIFEQYSAGTYFDGATIVDYETMLHDHPELTKHDDTQACPTQDDQQIFTKSCRNQDIDWER